MAVDRMQGLQQMALSDSQRFPLLNEDVFIPTTAVAKQYSH